MGGLVEAAPVEIRVIGERQAVRSALAELQRRHGTACKLHGTRRGKKGDTVGRATLYVG